MKLQQNAMATPPLWSEPCIPAYAIQTHPHALFGLALRLWPDGQVQADSDGQLRAALDRGELGIADLEVESVPCTSDLTDLVGGSSRPMADVSSYFSPEASLKGLTLLGVPRLDARRDA